MQVFLAGTGDIGHATRHRQGALRELARHVGVILVVGARKNSNANRLVDIAVEATFRGHVRDDGGAFDPEWVRGARTMGLTAARSFS